MHSITTTIDEVGLELEKNVFDVRASIEESSQALVIGELSLFKRLSIFSTTCANPLTWWCMHEAQFLNVGFLAKQIFGILGSQIKIEWVFIFVGVLTTLRHYCLQMDNMDCIITILKN
jgi:hypothetical protein